jgi:hypothetical protein
MVDFIVDELRLYRAIVNEESVYTHAKLLVESMLYFYVITFCTLLPLAQNKYQQFYINIKFVLNH